MPNLAAIALGSNLGDRAANLRAAIEHLRLLGSVEKVSSFHQTTPVGYLDQSDFLNAAALLRSALPPLELLHALLAIEKKMGRDRTTAIAKGPRLIDLDLLLYVDERGDDVILNTPDLTLPHPSLHERRFVLAPLAEIAPDLIHPVLNKSIAALLNSLQS